MAEIDDKPFPRGMLIAAGVLVALSVGAVAAARTGLVDSSPEVIVAAQPVLSRDVRFTDREDGAVIVQVVGGDASTIIPAETGGFVRGVVRSFVRARKMRGIDDGPPFRLTRWSDGQVSIEDTATGRRLGMGAFGPTNKQAVADLLRQIEGGA
jgi:putative photosynthetic complex assembly protein